MLSTTQAPEATTQAEAEREAQALRGLFAAACATVGQLAPQHQGADLLADLAAPWGRVASCRSVRQWYRGPAIPWYSLSPRWADEADEAAWLALPRAEQLTTDLGPSMATAVAITQPHRLSHYGTMTGPAHARRCQLGAALVGQLAALVLALGLVAAALALVGHQRAAEPQPQAATLAAPAEVVAIGTATSLVRPSTTQAPSTTSTQAEAPACAELAAAGTADSGQGAPSFDTWAEGQGGQLDYLGARVAADQLGRPELAGWGAWVVRRHPGSAPELVGLARAEDGPIVAPSCAG